MARICRLVFPSCHLIPSVRHTLAPFHFSSYLLGSANHISVRHVMCFPVLQPSACDAPQQLYSHCITHTYILAALRFRLFQMHRSCARRSHDPARPLGLPMCFMVRQIRNITCQIVSVCVTGVSRCAA